MIIKQALYRHTAIPTVEKGLDAGALRDKAIANNLANVNTPNYKRIDVQFESELRQALNKDIPQGSKTKSNHMPHGRKEITEVYPTGYRSADKTLPGEINNVDIDIEMAKLAENKINFEYAVKMMNSQTGSLKAAIKGKPQ